MAFKSPALLSLGDARSPPQAARAAAVAAAAARADLEHWGQRESRLPFCAHPTLLASASRMWGMGGDPRRPFPHPAQKAELARGERGPGLPAPLRRTSVGQSSLHGRKDPGGAGSKRGGKGRNPVDMPSARDRRHHPAPAET